MKESYCYKKLINQQTLCLYW